MIRWIAIVCIVFGATGFADAELKREAEQAIRLFKKKDKTFEPFLKGAYAYIVFPGVGKGGLIVGAAHGNGIVYQGGKPVGRASLSQGSIGFQAGGQEFAEVVLFENEKSFHHFKKSELAVSAEISGVVAKEGAAKKTRYHKHVAVFVLPKGGLMVEASVAGQKLEFKK